MFGPYRTPPPPQRVDDQRPPHEEIVLGWGLLLLGGVRTVLAVVTGGPWGAEATIAALMIPAGLHLLMRSSSWAPTAMASTTSTPRTRTRARRRCRT